MASFGSKSPLALIAFFAWIAACGSDDTFPYFGPEWQLDTDGSGDAADAGDAVAVDASPDVEVGPSPGELGAPCDGPDDCDDGLCEEVSEGYAVCTRACGEGCPAGWSCDADVCTCEAVVEVCDGSDNDCDGVADEGPSSALGCAAGDVCRDGGCACPAGQTRCGGVCTDTMADDANCGGCGEVCGVGTVCEDGTCGCTAPRALCGDTCVDTDSDPDHCGECDNACGASETCEGSACACPTGERLCDGTCVDTTSDADHCGACGESCRDGERCDGSSCVCEARHTLCADGCRDLRSDRNNCGECGEACAPGVSCVAGSCGCPCGGDACDAGTCVSLAGATETVTLDLVSSRPVADILVNFDATGSMTDEASELRTRFASEFVPASNRAFAEPAFGLAVYRDFPCSPYGGSGDVPYELRQRITRDGDTMQAALDAVSVSGGGDGPEAGVDALYQIATGAGSDTGCYTIPPFDPDRGWVEGVADGPGLGVGFRDGAFPIILHVTDNSNHDAETGESPYHASREATYRAISDRGAAVVGLATGAAAHADLVEFATRSRAVVPVCAWDEACGVDKCCTGEGGAGEASNDGECPLVYRLPGDADGLIEAITDAFARLGRVASFTVSTRARRDEATFTATGRDTSCLLDHARIVALEPPEDLCGYDPTPFDSDGDFFDDSVAGMTGAAPLTYTFTFSNGPCGFPSGVYPVHVDVLAGPGVFASRTYEVYVP